MSPQTIRSLIGVSPSAPSVTDSVLVIIDAQNEYANGKLKVADVEVSQKVIKALLDKYRASNGSVVHVVADTPPGAPIFTPGTELAEIFEELTPKANEPVVHKHHASAFTGTDFQEQVTKTGKKKLVVVGYMAHNCVSATVRAGAELGYDISVLRDAVGDRDIPGANAEELVRVSLAELADTVATILDSKDI
ncbi:Isochorismatase hydrolase [Eremomyces bilateralis CBS 781.70]|uniref:Isochorismatase hydrolase n=1 Tax=Eremomyces bilateralis CBS 781.70 TaxID=1392243 RepID=A0A6G1GHK7_9PEZI|nr:Isochorismatase hydrolase [Eremomyces bilateralis CBS 781.70]KAF1817381.1 Isochorismatase hydrolase [Eremomyces bilateralis CBS 781.70]